MTRQLPAGRRGTPLRYRWSHRNPVHRVVVRSANRILPHVPFRVKYWVTGRIRSSRLPYSLIGPGAVAVQVGAPRDTLLSGRSRAMAFALATHPGGRVLVVEPDGTSVAEFRRLAARHGLTHVELVHAAAWSEPGNLTLEIDASHPATNFVAGVTEYRPDEMRRFEEVAVRAVPLDDVIDEAGLDRVDVVSVTTNGSEREILRGLSRTISAHSPYICLARTEDSYADVMAGLGYELLGDDDRGFTFRRRA